MSEPLVVDAIADVCALEPSAENWQRVCTVIDTYAPMGREWLTSAVADAREAITRWPAEIRAIGEDSAWLAGIFDGVFDPRLELVGWATIRWTRTDEDYGARDVSHLVEAFARHLDPAFDPPPDIFEEEDNYRSNNGCGGGSTWEKRGNATQYIYFHSSSTETAADIHSDNSWHAHGLAPGTSVVVNSRNYYDDLCELIVSGPSPAVFELAPVWQTAVKGALIEECRALLRTTHVPWRQLTPATTRSERTLEFMSLKGTTKDVALDSILSSLHATRAR